jgi:hypothetical protein
VWLALWGDVDGATSATVSTCVHLQLYLAGLSAPEWLAALRGRAVSPLRARAAFVPVLLAEAWCAVVFALGAATSLESLARWFPLLAGAFWCGVAAWARSRTTEASEAVSGTARIGQMLLVVAAVTAWPSAWAAGPREVGMLVALAGVGAASAASTRVLGAGVGSALLAAVASLLVLAGRAAPDPALVVALAAPAAVVVHGRALARTFGTVLGIAAFAIALGRAEDAAWPALAFAGASAWIAAVETFAVARDDLDALDVGEAARALGAALWALLAWRGAFASVPVPLLNAGTAAAVAILGVPLLRRAGRSALRVEAAEPPAARADGIVRVAMLGLLLGAAWREWHALAGSATALALGSWHAVAFLVVATFACDAWGRVRGSPLHRAAAGALLGAAHLVVFRDAALVLLGHGAPPWVLPWELALLALPPILAAARSDRAEGAPAWTLVAALSIAAAAAFALRAVAADVWVANPRIAVALVGAAAAGSIRARTRVPFARVWLALACTGLAWYGGLLEVLDLVARVGPPTLRDALVSVYSAIACVATLSVGFVRRAADLRWLALAGFGAVVAKVGLHDLAGASAAVRVLASGVLGLLLLGSAYAYARRERRGPAPARGDGETLSKDARNVHGGVS